MNKRCVVNVAVDQNSNAQYVKWQKRLLASLDQKGGRPAVLFWTNEYPPGSPKHCEWAYAFKLYAIKEARLKGFETIIWMDAGLYAVEDLGPIFQAVEESGVYVVRDDNALSKFCSDETLSFYGMTREEAREIKLASGALLGFDFTKEIAHDIWGEWWKAFEAQLYRGTVSKHSGMEDHRGDESILAILLHRHGIAYRTRAEHFSSDGDVQPMTSIRSGYVDRGDIEW